MASTIKLKRSSTPGAVPGSLAAGELAINLSDKKIFSSNGSSVFSVSGDNYNLSSSSGTNGEATLNLTVDNAALSNDAIQFLGGTNMTVTRNANGAITFAHDDTAATADGLSSAVTVTLTGDVTGTASFTNAGDTATIAATIAGNSVALGTDTTGNYVSTISGTANEVTVSGSGTETAAVTIGLPDNVTIGNNLTVSGNTAVTGDLVVDGSLEVNGTLTYIDSTTVTIGDNMLKLANTNSADTIDTGFYSLYNSSGNKYTGLVRDASDGSYYLFDGLTTEPGQTINFGSTNMATLNAVLDGGTF